MGPSLQAHAQKMWMACEINAALSSRWRLDMVVDVFLQHLGQIDLVMQMSMELLKWSHWTLQDWNSSISGIWTDHAGGHLSMLRVRNAT